MQPADQQTSPALAEGPTFERIQLDDESWVDVSRGWLQNAGALYDKAVEQVPWRESKLFRYEKWVPEPRLGSMWKIGSPPIDPVVVEAHRALQHRYKVRFDGFAFAWYRDGNDSVAFHRDREMRWLEDTVIGVLTLGARRPWLLRPRANRYDHAAELKGATHDFSPASGDLLVLGGACQARWEHSVPKVDPRTAGRISLQWRWTSRRGRMETGGSYRAPRHFSS
jgi:alkylated DNA repair dioxygenase AlkB